MVWPPHARPSRSTSWHSSRPVWSTPTGRAGTSSTTSTRARCVRSPSGGPSAESNRTHDPRRTFAVDDIHTEVERLKGLGVVFTQDPTDFGPVVTAVFDDTCGNLIQLAALK
ncbi:VOC family protein [Actinoplanes xinjiangensis]